ncbi:hypothetical protein [Streptomyces sp. NPDC046862]|uniref:hypothetical protein n=1 Tax=Streptomyces sp. NPDC046862 TaxID=3154603 RepID=UPI003453F7E1
MQSSPNPPGPPVTSGPPGTVRMPRPVMLVLVLLTLHGLGYVFGGWAIIDETRSRQEHGQDPHMPMAMTWFVALFCWGLAALQAACVVRARRRRTWIRVVLIVCLSLVSLSMVFAFIGSLASDAPSLAAFLVAGFDIAALWMVSGETGRAYFSVRGPASASGVIAP